MADYIDRDKVAELIDYHQEEYCEAESYFGLLKEDFLKLPSADVAPVVHGKWNHGYCSKCGYYWGNDAPIASVPNFCPNCGAKMDLLN